MSTFKSSSARQSVCPQQHLYSQFKWHQETLTGLKSMKKAWTKIKQEQLYHMMSKTKWENLVPLNLTKPT